MTETELVIADLLPQRRTVEYTKSLAVSIKKEGLRFPIVVSDGVVIDGLKRLQALHDMGVEKVPAIVSDHFGELCLALERSREGAEPTPGRLIDMATDLWASRHKFIKTRRFILGRDKKGADDEWKGISVRELLARAIGISQGRTEVLTQVILAARTDPEARQALAAVRTGETTLYGFTRWQEKRKLESLVPVVSADEVRTVMDRGLRALATNIEAMSGFGMASVLGASERARVVAQLEDRRKSILKIMTMIKKGLEEEVEEQ